MEHYIIELMKVGYENPKGVKTNVIDVISEKFFNKKHSFAVKFSFETMFKDNGSNKYYLKPEYFARYIDYLELQQARISSKHAMCTAIGSICIAIATSIISIIIGCQQLQQAKKPIKIHTESLQEVERIIDESKAK